MDIDVDNLTILGISAKDITLVGSLVFILLGGYRKWWVWGYQLTDEKTAHAKTEARLNEWIAIAWSITRATEKTSEAVLQAVTKVTGS